MSKYKDFVFCLLPSTPSGFDIEKFKSGDPVQQDLYRFGKTPTRRIYITYEDLRLDDGDGPNYARVVPDDCCFIDFDDSKEAEEMRKIILHAGLRCLILKTQHGYHFLFRKPEFYDKEKTGAINWFGCKFDAKADNGIQVIKPCGMEREERASWALDELIAPKAINTEELDELPYWLWGRLKDDDLHKGGKTGDRSKDGAVTYTLKDNPFTQLMKMREGGRHDHIFSKCSYFGISNGFKIDEFKALIQIIHDVYLVKIGSAMSYSDMFGDLEERWDDYKALLSSGGWEFDKKYRVWTKPKDKKEDRIDERRAAEFVFSQLDCYVVNKNLDGTFSKILHRYKDGDYNYRFDLPERSKI
jgi:hypothetical protein